MGDIDTDGKGIYVCKKVHSTATYPRSIQFYISIVRPYGEARDNCPCDRKVAPRKLGVRADQTPHGGEGGRLAGFIRSWQRSQE